LFLDVPLYPDTRFQWALLNKNLLVQILLMVVAGHKLKLNLRMKKTDRQLSVVFLSI
jgi:hypothetical protein